MSLSGIIKEPVRLDCEIIKKLKKSKNLIYIYGAGNVGLNCLEFLSAHNIIINGFLIDDEFFKDSVVNGLKVTKVSDFKGEREVVDIVIGFVNYREGIEKIKEIHNVESTYCLSNPCMHLKDQDITWEYYCENQIEFLKAYQLFEDDLSKSIFISYMNTRINLNFKHLLPFGDGETYFNEIVPLAPEIVYMDIGAYNGDSIQHFLIKTKNKYKYIYAIEPDRKNFSDLQKYVNEKKIDNIALINKGCWSEKTVIQSEKKLDGQRFCIRENFDSQKDKESVVEVDTIDNILADSYVDFIKISAQGVEEEILKGAAKTLRRSNPTLSMCIFYNRDSLFKIPQLIKEINPRYQLYLRCSDPYFIRVILYARYKGEK